MTDLGSHWAQMSVPPDEHRLAAWRLADELRRIIELLTLVDAPTAELQRAADAARGFADRLDELLPKRTWSYEGFSETAVAGSPLAFFDRSPIIGRANPLAAPIEVGMVGEGDDMHVEGRARFSAAYEGPPGTVHGGFMAAAFDEVLGMAQAITGKPGMTGTLKIVYRAPTPLYAEVRFEAGVDRVEGRKIFASGRSFVRDKLTAEAEGIFISVDFEKFAEMMRERDARRAE